MQEADRHDEPIATGPVPLNPADGTPGIFVYRALRNEGAPHPYGWVSVALRPDALLSWVSSRDTIETKDRREIYFFGAAGEAAPRYLASTHFGDVRIVDNPPTLAEAAARPDAFVASALDFGSAYALVTTPDVSAFRAHAFAAALKTVGVGLLLTLLSTALVNAISGRRAALEAMVAARTAELRASEGSYRGLFNSIRQAIYIQDESGRFLDVNDGAVAMYGYAREEFIGRTPEFLNPEGKNDMAAVQRAIERARAGEPQYFQFWGRRKSGEIFPKDVWLNKGNYFGQEVLIATAADVSARHRAEEEQARLHQQLQQAQKMESIGRLAGGVAHDFNNMLQAILGFSGLAIEQNRVPSVAEYLAEIKRSAERSADLTRQLLAFASRQTVKPQVLELNLAIEQAIKMLRRLIGEDIRLTWKPGSGIGCVKIDPTQLDQILANLAANARDAIPCGGAITITTSVIHCRGASSHSRFTSVREGLYAVFTLQDSGLGMEAETMAHLFEPFYTTKEKGKGVGLGLATVFGIVKQNEGFLDVQSEPGAGTTFVIGFPRIAGAEPAPAAKARPAATLSGSETILFVEDERAILRFGSECLTALGYNVLVADSPREAIKRCAEHEGPIHLAITDVVLPEMNGRELAAAISQKRPAIKCIFISGYTADIMASHGLLDRDIHFIAKPFSADALAARVREVLDRAPSA